MRFALFALVALAVAAARADVVGKPVEYKADSVTLRGYIAFDDKAKGKHPGILVVHEWWGNNEYTRKRAEMLAKLGYVALAVDMYGNGKQANQPDEAGKLSGEVMKNLPVMRARFLAALDLLKKNDLVDPEHIAAIGYCFGGGVVLAMARDGVDLKGVVSFHGSLGTSTPAEKGKVKTKILACTGAADPFVPPDVVKKFKDEMTAAGADFKVISYEGAKHSFTNPASTEAGKKFNLPLEYNQKADKESWAEMEMFFKTLFKK
jgi:dienelactone hydrolase